MVDCTSASPLATKVIDISLKQSGYAAAKAQEEIKRNSYSNTNDTDTYELLQLVMEHQFGGVQEKDLQNLSKKCVTNKGYNQPTLVVRD